MRPPYGMAQLHREDMGEAAPSVWAWREGFADGWGLHSAQRDKVGPTRGMREGIPRKGDETGKGRSEKSRACQASGRPLGWLVWSEDGRMEQEAGPGGKSLEHRSQGLFTCRW